MAADNIQVAIKVRPMLKKESKLTSHWKIVDNSIQLVDSQSEPFYFDHIFDENATNERIFNTMAKPIVDAALRGFNGTIFAYGQTSSGKTYTMLGDEKNPGVMLRAGQEIFKEIDKVTDRAFLLRAGYIEIYNEKIYDLLDKKNTDLKIHETGTGEFAVNCTDFIIRCEDEMFGLLQTGNKARRIGETIMNERSSRSHAIFRIIIESRELDKATDETAVEISHLNLVDLAGSERADQTGATGSRLKEGCHINKSLLSLSLVIKKLSENESDKFINYRDSKLTRILQASLGGNALTAIICTIKSTTIEETNSTLSFAMRAKSIKNKPHKNEILSDAAMMKRLAKEISRLQNELEVEKSKNSKIKIARLEQQIKDEELKIVHSHAITTEKKRRRTWCPSGSLPEDVNGSSNGNVPKETNKTKMFMTPMIPSRDYQEFEIDEEEFIPAENAKFILMDDRNMNLLSTPTANKKPDSKLSLSPLNDIRTKYKILETQFEELQEFKVLEKEEELSEAKRKIKELEVERQELIEIRDGSYENQVKLERSQQRCLELESRISELDERIHNLVRQQNSYQIEIEERQQKIKSLQMASKDIAGLEYEYENHKQISKMREEELVGLLAERDEKIGRLEKQLRETMQSQDPEAAALSSSCENCSLVGYDENVHVNQDVSTPSNDSLNSQNKLTKNEKNKYSYIMVNENSILLENLQKELDEYKKNLDEKEQMVNALHCEMQEMKQQNNNMEKTNNELSDQMMEYIYENEALANKVNEYEVSLKETENTNKELKAKVADIERMLSSSSNVHVQCSALIGLEQASITELKDIELDSKPRFETIPEEASLHEIAMSILEGIVDGLPIFGDETATFENLHKNNISQVNSDFRTNNLTAKDPADSVNQLNSSLKEQISNYESLNEELRLRLDTLSSNLSISESTNNEFNRKIEELEVAKNDLLEKLNEAKSRIQDLETKNTEIEDLAQRPAILQAEISRLQVQVDSLKGDMQLLEEERNEHQRVKKELTDQVNETKTQLKNLLQQKEAIILQSEEDIAKFKEQVQELEKELIQTRSEKEATDEKLFRVEETRCEFEEKIDSHVQKISNLEEANAKLNQSLKEFESLKNDLTAQEMLLATTKKELEEKELRLIEIESNFTRKLEDNKLLMEEKETLEQIVEDKMKKIGEFERQVSNFREEQNKLVEFLQLTSTGKLESDKEKNTLKSRIELLSQSERELQNALEACKQSISNFETEALNVKNVQKELEKRVKEYEETNNKLAAEMSVLVDEKTELQEQLKDIKSALLNIENLNTQHEENLKKQSTEIESLKETNTKLGNQSEQLQIEKENLQKTNELLNSDNEDLKKTLENMQQSLQNVEEECNSLKQSLHEAVEAFNELQQERDNLLEIKEQLENEFQRKLVEECELTLAELTNVRSQNIVLIDKMETLIAEKDDLQVLLNKNVTRTKGLEKEMNLLNEKLDNLHRNNMDLESKYSHAISENERLNVRISDYENTIADLEKEIKHLQTEQELITSKQHEQFEKANGKLSKLKSELESQLEQFVKVRKENEELKQKLAVKRDGVNDTADKEKEEILKQLHEMQKMHVYKIKQYQQEIQNLKLQQCRKDPVGMCNRMNTDENDKQRIIKTLLGENDELRLKNQNLTVELQETRKLSQKDRKTKRYSNHDETRSLSWFDSREIGTMTVPTDKLCSCEQLNKELTEARKALLIRDCQITALRMESDHHPLKEECETLKRTIEEEEAEKKEMRKELNKLRAKISELYKDTRKCDNCQRRSRTVFVNQFSQTGFEEKVNSADYSKLESDHERLLHKYEELKRLCRLRNSRIADLETQVARKENENPKLDSLVKEVTLLKKKYEEVKMVVGFRDKRIQALESELSQAKNSR